MFTLQKVSKRFRITHFDHMNNPKEFYLQDMIVETARKKMRVIGHGNSVTILMLIAHIIASIFPSGNLIYIFVIFLRIFLLLINNFHYF